MLDLAHDRMGRRYRISRGWRRAEGALHHEEARWVVADWAAGASEADLRRVLDELTDRVPSTWASRYDLIREIVSRVGWDLVVEAVPEPVWALPSQARVEEDEAPAREEPMERHDLRFAFEYPDRSPAGAWAYRFTDLDGNRSTGELPENGMIEESNVREGVYQVELKEVSSVHWLERAVDCGAEVALVAHVSGFDDGAAAKVRIFRQFAELDAQVVDTLDASVADGRVEHTFRFDYAASARRASQQGQLRFVAEVSLEDGRVWCKTLEPLKVQLKTLREVRWAERVVAPGTDAEIVVRTLGYPDGVEVALHLFVQDPLEGARELTVLSATLAGGEARARLLFAPSTEPSDPELEGDRIQRAGEYFVRALIEDDVKREARSDVLLCSALAAVG
jgi:hypothetical protein